MIHVQVVEDENMEEIVQRKEVTRVMVAYKSGTVHVFTRMADETP